MADPFSTVFADRLAAIEDAAARAGLSLSELCRRAGVARATPDRWRRCAPKTVRAVEALEAALAEAQASAPEVDGVAVHAVMVPRDGDPIG